MKNRLIPIGIGLLLYGFCMAQPTVGSDALLVFGEMEEAQFLDLTANNFDSGMKGENVNWNVNTIMEDQNNCLYDGKEAHSSIYADSFPNATIYFSCVITSDDGESSTTHTFYEIDGNKQYFHGSVSVSIDDPDFDSIFTVYDDPMLVMEFPRTFGDEFEDDFSARISSYTPGQFIASRQEGQVSSKIDAYGSLTTKAGIFNNVIREKRSEIAVVSVAGLPFTTTQESHRYNFLGEDENYVLLNMDSLVTKDAGGNELLTTYNGFYRTRGPSAVKNTLRSISAFSIFPNPAKTQEPVELRFTSEREQVLYVVIYDVAGHRTDYQQNFEVRVGENIIKMSTTDMLSGRYIVELADEKGRALRIPIICVE